MSEYQFAKGGREGKLRIATINRPEVYNALHSPAHAEFDKIFDDFDADPNLWVALITGAGKEHSRPETI